MRTLGLRVKSGFAIAVVLSGDQHAWRVESRAQVPLSAGVSHYARFPFHALIELNEPAAQSTHQEAVAAIKTAASSHMAALLHAIGGIDRAAIVGSTADPNSIGNTHMRMHALEGQLFRGVTAQALRLAEIPCEYLSDKDSYAVVARALQCPELELRARFSARPANLKPWRGDEKLAALGAAWRFV